MRILYIDIDALSPSHLSCYGYHRTTSPAIDAIGAEGVSLANYYTSDAPCMPSRTALYCGRFGIQTGVVGHGGTAAQPKIEGTGRGFQDRFDCQGMAQQLQKLGFHTAMVSPFGQRHSAHHIYAGFNEMHNTARGGRETAEQVMPVVDKWLDENAAGDQWYLHVNFWDAHTPYRTPLAYGDPFTDAPLPDWITDELLERHMKLTGPHTAQDVMMYHGEPDPQYPRHPGSITDRRGLRRMIDGYDTAIRYVDDQIKVICDKLKAAGVYDETAIIISADHGENQGELGIYGEHATADEGTCHIPMIIKWPGGLAGHLDKALHYNVDWAPTLIELLGGEPQPIWDGQSFAPAVRRGETCGRDELILSQCVHVCQRSVRFDQWLYIRTYHDGFHLFADQMLFDLAADPHEQHDVADQHPQICREAVWRLTRWHDAQMTKMAETSSSVVDPMWTVMQEGGPYHANVRYGQPPSFEDYLKRLESTGRTAGAQALRHKYPHLLT